MNHSDGWQALLTKGCVIRLVEDDIYSALPDVQHTHLYDKRATAYDAVVGTWLYNRVMWGTSPADYVTFAREALDSHPKGRMLDAACGSLLFTAQSYLASNRQIIAFDQSLQMLKRARARLIQLAGAFPEHIVLLQADLSNVVFQPATFDTVLCMNVLHQFAAATELIPKLRGLLVNRGQLYLTSLVSNGRYVGDRWLAALYKTGEFVRPRTSAELIKVMGETVGETSYGTKGNMAFATLGADLETPGG